jgi:hypothetical protein
MPCFRIACLGTALRMAGVITYREFMLGLAAMNPDAPHAPPFLRVRLFYIFRLYDTNSDGSMQYSTVHGSRALVALASFMASVVTLNWMEASRRTQS